MLNKRCTNLNNNSDNVRKQDAVNFFIKAGKQLEEGELSAVAVVIMAHGTENDEIKFSDDETCKLRKLLRPLLMCRNLNGKPKIVVTQFCRGTSQIATQIEPDSDEEIFVDGDVPIRVNDQVKIIFIFVILLVHAAYSMPEKIVNCFDNIFQV